jgi:signal recognition particle subunit SRP54
MVVSKLASGLRSIFERITKATSVNKELVRESVKDLQRTLLSADVNVRLVLELSKTIEKRVLEEKLPPGVSQREHFASVVYEELVRLMGEAHVPRVEPQKILLCGVFGHGKSTTCGKLAKFYSKRGLKTAIITTDTWRPAAFEQIEQLSAKIGVPMFGIKDEKNAPKILREGLKKFDGFDVIIVDSAGRDSLSDELIDELKQLDSTLRPEEKYLVLGADMGQTAGAQAEAFNKAIGLTGVIVTRLDSSAKGGGALSACAKAGVPITFIGMGEKVDDLEVYDGKKFVSRLLGFPDLPALLDCVKEAVEEAELSPEELMKGDFTLKTFYKQLEATRKMGSFGKIMEQLGMSAKLPQGVIEQSEEKLSHFKVIMESMTPQELENPDVISSSRIARIARGSGRSEKDVRELLKQYGMTKKMLRKFKPGKRMPKNLGRLLGQFGGGR